MRVNVRHVLRVQYSLECYSSHVCQKKIKLFSIHYLHVHAYWVKLIKILQKWADWTNFYAKHNAQYYDSSLKLNVWNTRLVSPHANNDPHAYPCSILQNIKKHGLRFLLIPAVEIVLNDCSVLFLLITKWFQSKENWHVL